MLIFKITFSATGDKFYPEKCLFSSSEKMNLIDFFSPNDKGMDYGSLSLMHPDVFAISGESLLYEEEFVSFFEKNLGELIKNGADSFDFFTEIYYSGDQCNFEIFNASMLERLYIKKNKISLPVSIYHLKKKEVKELLRTVQTPKNE